MGNGLPLGDQTSLLSVPADWTVSSHLCGRSFPPASLRFHICCNSWSIPEPGNRFESDPENDFYWLCTVWLRSIVFYLFSIVFCK